MHPDLRARFNETAAWEYARSLTGQPYGYHNLIFSWIDTIDQNYPPPLDAHLVLLSTNYTLNKIASWASRPLLYMFRKNTGGQFSTF